MLPHLAAAAIAALVATVHASQPPWPNFTIWSAGPPPSSIYRPVWPIGLEANGTAEQRYELRTSQNTLGDLADCMEGRTRYTFLFEDDEGSKGITVVSHHSGITDEDETDSYVLDCLIKLRISNVAAQLVMADDPRLNDVGLPPEYRDLRTGAWTRRDTRCDGGPSQHGRSVKQLNHDELEGRSHPRS